MVISEHLTHSTKHTLYDTHNVHGSLVFVVFWSFFVVIVLYYYPLLLLHKQTKCFYCFLKPFSGVHPQPNASDPP